jgi:hypothetical protein
MTRLKGLLVLAALTVSVLSFGQSFIVTPAGLRDATDSTKTYLVIPCEGKTAKELYDNAIRYITENYKNPDEVIKGRIDGEYLKFNSYKSEFLIVKNGGVNILFYAYYTTELSFKDGKVKYEIIELKITNDSNYSLAFTGSGMQWYIYNKKGELKREDAKTQIEDYFKGEVLTISNSLNGVEVVDEW